MAEKNTAKLSDIYSNLNTNALKGKPFGRLGKHSTLLFLAPIAPMVMFKARRSSSFLAAYKNVDKCDLNVLILKI